MKNISSEIQGIFRKLDFMAIAMGFVLMLVLAITATLVVGAFVVVASGGSEGGAPFTWHPSVESGLLGSALVAVCSFSGGFLTSRRAKQAPVQNAMLIPALETLRKFAVLAFNLAVGHPISTITYPLWLSLTDLVAFIGFSYLGAVIARRLRAKARTEI